MSILLVAEIVNLPNDKFKEFILKMISNRMIHDAISREQYHEIFKIMEIEADRHKVIELLIKMGVLKFVGDNHEQGKLHGKFQTGKRQGVRREEGTDTEGNG